MAHGLGLAMEELVTMKYSFHYGTVVGFKLFKCFGGIVAGLGLGLQWVCCAWLCQLLH